MEGDTINISCKIVQSKNEQIEAKWSKDGERIKFTDRVCNKVVGDQYTLVIHDSNKFDRGNYSIVINGRKRSLRLDVKRNYHLLF